MSDAWTVITLTIDHVRTHTESELAELAEQVQEVIYEHADWSGEHDDGEVRAQDVLDTTVATASVASRYEIDGAQAAAAALSEAWPLSTVTVLQQWTGGDKPTQSTTTYRRGEKASIVALAPVALTVPNITTHVPPLGHDVDVDDHVDEGGPWVRVEIPSNPDEHGRSHTLAVAEITPIEARALSASLLKAANGAEFHYARLEKEQADA